MDKLSKNYRVFLLSIESIYNHQSIQFLFKLKQNLKNKTLYKDIKILILCPCESFKLMYYIKQQEEENDDDEIFHWVTSSSLAKHLSLFITPNQYYGRFLFSIEPKLTFNESRKKNFSSSLTSYWQLLSHCDDNMEWFIKFIISTRTDWENRCQMIYKIIHNIIYNDPFFNSFPLCQHGNTKRSLSSTWGWQVLPLEIQQTILNQMEISDILLCYQASLELKKCIIPWLYEHLQFMIKDNQHEYQTFQSFRDLQCNANYLSYLYFHLSPFLKKEYQSLEIINL
ncbi:unnamed protein product [Cunninghamella blakesleeana]